MATSKTKALKKLYQLATVAQIAEEMEKLEKEDQKEKRVWVRPWISRRQKEVPLFTEVETEDREKFFADFRLYPEEFDNLLHR